MSELARIQPVKSAACPQCGTVLNENALQLALQGRVVRCGKCRKDVKLTKEQIDAIRKSRRSS